MSLMPTRTRPHPGVAGGTCLCLALLFISLTPAAADDFEAALAQAREIEQDLVEVLDQVSDASVTVIHYARLPASLGGGSRGPLLVSGAGSGVLVKYRGTHVVTNAHVVKGASNIHIVIRDGTRIPVTVRVLDESIDLAILTLPSTQKGLKPVGLEGDAAPVLREGAWVLATGNPFMLAHDGQGAATLGVFSGARGAAASGAASGVRYLLQHDAEINPGNSGGPLWSRAGELLGINGAIVTRSMVMGTGPSYTGTSISVPVTQVRRFLDRALPQPRGTSTSRPATSSPRIVTRARRRAGLGLRLITSRDARGRADGALVIGITKTSTMRAPRARGALQSGDRITHVSARGKRILVRSRREFEAALAGSTKVSIHYVRGGQLRTWSGAVGGQ